MILMKNVMYEWTWPCLMFPQSFKVVTISKKFRKLKKLIK